MDFNSTIDLIIKDLDDARNIIDDLKKYPGVPVLQVELAKAKCKSAGEVIALLKNTEESRKATQTTVELPPQPEKVPEIHEKIPEIIQIEEEIHIEKPEVVPEIIQAKEKIHIEKPEETEAPVKDNVETKKPSVKSTESSIIADKFSHLSNRFNEQLGSKQDDGDISEILNKKPITKLEDAIGVNDRFLFIREIFNNDKDVYSRAITQLDKAENIKDARAIIMSHTGDNEENTAVKQLMTLLKRKFPGNE